MARNRNVYILGAGFSAAAGVPVMATFLQTARDFFESPRSQSQMDAATRKHYEHVFRFRHAAKQSRDSLRIDLENIEELFGLIDMMEMSQSGPRRQTNTSQSIKHLIAHTVSRFTPPTRSVVITLAEAGMAGLPHRDLFERFRVQTSGYPRYEMPQYQFAAALFAGLFDPPKDQVTDAVITFNYDTILEGALWELGVQVDYNVKRITRVGRDPLAGHAASLSIAKMHGSSNWAKAEKKRGLRADVYNSYRDFPEGREPIVVPPTWRKGELSPLLGEVWSNALNYLSTATRICVIGYSMPPTDIFFQHLMGAALSQNPMIYKLFVVDYEGAKGGAKAVDERYKAMFEPLDRYGHYEFSDEGAMGFLHKGNLEKLQRGSLISSIELAR